MGDHDAHDLTPASGDRPWRGSDAKVPTRRPRVDNPRYPNPGNIAMHGQESVEHGNRERFLHGL